MTDGDSIVQESKAALSGVIVLVQFGKLDRTTVGFHPSGHVVTQHYIKMDLWVLCQVFWGALA